MTQHTIPTTTGAASDRAPVAGLFNTAQTVLLQSYGSGDFKDILQVTTKAELDAAMANSDDGLLRYLMVELSAGEQCESTADACERISLTIKDLQELQRNIAVSQAETSSVLKVSIDGGRTFFPAPEGVRVIYEQVEIPDLDDNAEVHFNLTEEGVITDILVTMDEPLDTTAGTRSEHLSDLIAALM